MLRKLLLKVATWLLRLTYERVTLDKVNQKLIRPVEGLVIDGVQYYEFVNVSDMPASRFVHYQHYRRELAKGGADDELINKYLDQMEKANDKGDRSWNGSLIYMLRDTVNNCTPIELMYTLAAMIYFDKAEDLSCFDSDYNIAKIKLFKAVPNQTFFLNRLLQRGLRAAGQESHGDIEKYLKRSAVKLSAYRQILTDHSENNTSKTLNEQ